jgi:outer membrane protein TolC
VLSESRPFFADLVTITQSMYAVGRKTQYDVLHAELELSRLDDRLIEADQSRGAAQASLAQWLSNDAYRPVADKLPAWEQVPKLADLQQNLNAHPLLQAADADISARQSGIDLANEKRKPGWALDLGYGYREGYLADGTPRSDFISVSVTVDLPMFKKNRQDRDLAAALSERSAAVATKGQLHAQLRSELNSEHTRWTDLSRRIALYEAQILQLSKNQAEAALLAYQSDAGDFSDVMRAQVNNLDTRLEHIGLQIERAQSYAVIANLGGLAR